MDIDKRKHPRFPAHARVRIPKLFNGEVLLKDISITGCGIASAVPLNIKQGDRFSMEIICEPASRIGNFDLQVEAMWIRKKDNTCEAGFSIVASPTGKQFEHYVDYLSFRSNSE